MATGPWSLQLLLVGLLLAGSPALGGIPLPGGPMNVPVTTSEVQEAARAAVGTFNQKSDSPYVFRMEKVISAQSQVVSGVMYYLTVELEKTLCLKEAGGDSQTCALPPTNQQQKLICDFKVWTRPWLHVTQVVSQRCDPAQA